MRNPMRVVVWGAGGHGKVVLDALLAANRCEVVGFLDDDETKAGRQFMGFPVLRAQAGLAEVRGRLHCEAVALAIGDNQVREQKFLELGQCGLQAAGVIHPAACVSRLAEVGTGVVILAGALVGPGTVIEDNVCVNAGASVDHDNRLMRSCHIFPHATLTGGVSVGRFSYVGSGATIVPNRTIGSFAYVGAGAVVTRDVPEGVTVVGVPARPIEGRTQPRQSTAPVGEAE